MNYQAPPDWNRLRAFLATAEAGSLSGAAKVLGLTQPTLSRQVSALENQLSLLLFERVGRGLELTDAGRELLAHVREMGAAADRLTVSAIGQQSGISGRVSISASDILSHTLLPGVVAELRRRAPQLAIEVVATNQLSDLLRREADIAIRHVRPEQPNLVARRVREGHGLFYAASDYLARKGRPATPEAMAALDWVAFGDPALMCGHIRAMGVPVSPESFVVHSENGIVAWEMVCSGMGVCPMDASIAAQEPRVEPVLPEVLSVDFPVWLVTHREIHNSPRIRLVFDHLAEVLARV
ncbi:LysR family transcriptional regulator [Salibaculum halophilum]|uniref:LysR family transcriptional regulator n=1 Tax=Salibaculum halophilum TaxID=1914408 RepID=UPI000A122D8A|nr:LysR family transcriptional regulator [Salibaculum halophilum]